MAKDGIVRVSPTQINTYDDEKNPSDGCKRKWAWAYIAGLKTPPTASMQFGTDVHAVLEAWLKKGQKLPDDDVGATARQGIKKGWLPTPHENLAVEQYLEIPLHKKLKLIGYADCIVPPELNPFSGWPVVIDHKSTSDMRYAKKAGDLIFNAQPVIYGRWSMSTYHLPTAEARWIYYAASGRERPRKPKGSRMEQLVYTAEGPRPEGLDPKAAWAPFEPSWNHIVSKAEEMAAHRTDATDPMKIEPNALACSAYGGCPYRSRCTDLTSGHKLKAHFAQFDKVHGTKEKKEGHMSLMDTLNQIKAEKEGKAPTPGPAAEPAPSPTPAEAPKTNGNGGKQWWLKGKQDGHQGMNPPETAESVEAPETTPEAPPASPASPAKAPAVSPLVAAAKAGASSPEPAKTETTDAPPSAPSAEVAASEEKKPVRRTYKIGLEEGRAEGYKLGYEEGEAHAKEVEPLPPMGVSSKEDYQQGHAEGFREGKDAADVAAPTVAPVATGLRVFIGCFPTKTEGEILSLSDVLPEIMAQVAEKEGVPHWNLAPYAQGAALLAQAVDAAWSNGGKPSGVLLVDMRSAEGRAIRTVLDAHADEIIEALA